MCAAELPGSAVRELARKRAAGTPAVRYDTGGTPWLRKSHHLLHRRWWPCGDDAWISAALGLASPVVVLEKHRDFFRDFRGDTIHPSTIEVMDELGLLDVSSKSRIRRLHVIGGHFDDADFIAADFSHLPVNCKFVVLMPQWDFLNFIAKKRAVIRRFN